MQSKKILICPLDWGLGHAIRDIPIIHHLLSKNHQISIAADGDAYCVLKKEFPQLSFLRLSFVKIKYSSGNNLIKKLLVQSPKIVYGFVREYFLFRKILNKHHFDIVISDNRLFLWTKKATTIYISHQLMIKMPMSFNFLEPIFFNIHKSIIKKYDYYIVPDFKEQDGLSGDLSHKYKLPHHGFFMSGLSRFFNLISDCESEGKQDFDVLFILSGPEPQRTIFEKLILNDLKGRKGRFCLVRGVPNVNGLLAAQNNLSIENYLSAKELLNRINSAKYIVCRSGYTSIMDLVALKKNATLIPTPGQTEQEYLAEYLQKKGIFYCMCQRDFSLDLINMNKHLYSVKTPFYKFNDFSVIDNIISSL